MIRTLVNIVVRRRALVGGTLVALLALAALAQARQNAAPSGGLKPIADSTADASHPRRTAPRSTLLVGGGRTAYLKFAVPAGADVRTATLYLYVLGANKKGVDVRATSTSWTESKLTKRNAPKARARLGRSGGVKAGKWTDVDVTDAVAAGKTVAFALTSSSKSPIRIASREAGSKSPQLVVERVEPEPTSTPTPTPEPTSTPTPTPPPANNAPNAVDDDQSTPEDTPADFDVLANDSTGDTGQTLVLTRIVSGPATIVAGKVHFVPDPNFNGSRTIGYEACDDGSPVLCDTATLTVTVTPVDDPPDAADDDGSTPEDMPKDFDVLANDSAGDAETLVLTISPPESGASIVDDKVHFVPAADFNGTSTVGYKVCDSDKPDTCDTATLTIMVTPVNDAPVTTADNATVEEDRSVLIDVLGNDNAGPSDEPATLTLGAAQQLPAHGEATIEPDPTTGIQKVRYTPHANFFGTDGGIYTACDSSGACTAGTVSVTVTPVNDAPVMTDDEATTPEDTPIDVDVVDNDTPGPQESGSQTVALSTTLVSEPQHGDASVVAGKVRYTPDADFNGADTLDYRACDSETPSRCAIATLHLTVDAVNDAPEPARDQFTVAPGAEEILDPVQGDSPGAGEDGQTLTLKAVDPPSYGTAEKTDDGKVRYRARAGHGGSDWFDYTVCDSGDPEECTTATVYIWTPQVRTIHPRAETASLPAPTSYGEDVAIWRNAEAPQLSALLATDRATQSGDGGLGVYGLSGEQLQYLPSGSPSSVDVRDGFNFTHGSTAPPLPFDTGPAPLVLAGDRQDQVVDGDTVDSVHGYRLDPVTRQLLPAGSMPFQLAISSTCMYRNPDTGSFYVFLTNQQGTIQQWQVQWRSSGLLGNTVKAGAAARELNLDAGAGTELAGCTVDDVNNTLYVVQQGVGLWKFDATFDGDPQGTLVDGLDGNLRGDLKSVAVASDGTAAGGHVVVSMQGGEQYAIYKRNGQYERTVRIGPLDGIDGAASLGIDATEESMGDAFPNGLLLAQDKDNTDALGEPAEANAKLADMHDATETRAGENTPEFPERDTGCARPYSERSPWNTPIADDAAYDPGSTVHVAAIDGKLSSDPDQFTYPVYEVTADTPTVPVQLSGVYSNVTGEETLVRSTGPTTVDLPIPEGAGEAAGDDAQIILVNRTTGDEWGLWHVERDANGVWSAENGYHYNTGWWAVPPAGFGSRGAGVPYLTGLVRPCEIARGQIDHALAFAYDDPTPQWVFPATKSDGHSAFPDMPEGARLQLDPSLTTADIEGWGCTGPCLTIAKALQEYGMYLIDHAGHPKLMLEYRDTAGWSPAVDAATVRPIPVEQLKLLDLGELQGP